jgi:two-component system, chemotaxis family, chemotaxis protein CheY
MKALIIDDQPLFLKKLVENFEYDIELTVAEDGKTGLDNFFLHHKRGEPFDLLFLDLDLPIIRGEDILIAIRSYEDTMSLGNIKVIVISADQKTSKVMDLFKRGCEYYIKKPIDKNSLKESVSFVYKGFV